MRSFDFARKMEDEKPVMDFDENGVYGEVKAYPNAQLPEYQTKHSAGADFFCAEDVTIPSMWKTAASVLIAEAGSILTKVLALDARDSKVFLKQFQPTLVHTGIKSEMEEDEVLYLYNRSSNPKKMGLILANSVGVIDADYFENVENDGEIVFAFYNIFPWDITIKRGTRIGQGVFQKFLRPVNGLRIKDEVRVGGLGSTDNK